VGTQAGGELGIAFEADVSGRLAERHQRGYPAGDLEDRHLVTERVIFRCSRLGAAGAKGPATARAGRGRADPGPDTLWTLATALDGLSAVLAAPVNRAAGAIVPIVYW
jgi:hypothetical protein